MRDSPINIQNDNYIALLERGKSTLNRTVTAYTLKPCSCRKGGYSYVVSSEPKDVLIINKGSLWLAYSSLNALQSFNKVLALADRWAPQLSSHHVENSVVYGYYLC